MRKPVHDCWVHFTKAGVYFMWFTEMINQGWSVVMWGPLAFMCGLSFNAYLHGIASPTRPNVISDPSKLKDATLVDPGNGTLVEGHPLPNFFRRIGVRGFVMQDEDYDDPLFQQFISDAHKIIQKRKRGKKSRRKTDQSV